MILSAGVGVAGPPQQRSAIQIACAQPRPDVRVIELLLDHGAKPNMPDPAGERPLQMLTRVLGSTGGGDGASGGGGGDGTTGSPGTAEAASGAFAEDLTAACACVQALILGGGRLEMHGKAVLGAEAVHPALLHVAKQSAARFKADRTGTLRLQPVANSLSDMVHAQLGSSWVEDAKVNACMACAAPFTNAVRRHHCRLFGIVVCDVCSTRRALLPGQGTNGVRVCDPAYNIIRYLGRLAAAHDAAATKARQEKEAAEEAKRREVAAQRKAAAERDELLGGDQAAGAGSRAGGASTSTRAPTGKAAAASNVDSAGAAANEAVNALHQRGEKLGILGERVAKMEQEAQEFHDMARKMREQAERNSKWFPF